MTKRLYYNKLRRRLVERFISVNAYKGRGDLEWRAMVDMVFHAVVKEIEDMEKESEKELLLGFRARPTE